MQAVQVNTGTDFLSVVIGAIPLNKVLPCGLLLLYQGANLLATYIENRYCHITVLS